MSLMSGPSVESVQQQHPVYMANDLQWVEGKLETLGNPHNYINQDDLGFFSLREPRIAPWTFTGLPNSRAPEIVLARDSVQFMAFPGDEALEQFREAPRVETVIVNLPLTVVRGQAPFLSEAQLGNFLDFWKGFFFPLTNVGIHYLAQSTVGLPTEMPLIYVNRTIVQSYVRG